MINLIHGAKGSGKTKRIITSANDEIASAKGEQVYITDKSVHTREIDRRIRFVNIAEFVPQGEQWFVGFIKGMSAANSDITNIYVDGINRFLTPPEKMEGLLSELEKISEVNGIVFTLTISTGSLPDFMKKYL